mmetsp:Transcript_58810/g.158492  ORF Transcript_58810/g.158492 Transcript_58810/m.158492 type:complete len:124 (-) Transcript_58810:300-671(-)
MGHTKRPIHLDKRHREQLRNMTKEEWAGLVLPILQRRLEASDNSTESREMFASIVTQCDIPIGSAPVIPQRSQRMLVLTLRSMSFKALISAVRSSLAQCGDQVEATFDALLHHLRMRTMPSLQ